MIKKRFIAGAKCPKCGADDRIVMMTTKNDEWIECIDCNYSERRPTHLDDQQPMLPDNIGVIQFKPNPK